MVFELGAQMLLLLQIDGGGCDVIVNPTTALPMLRIDLDLVCFFFILKPQMTWRRTPTSRACSSLDR